MYLKNASQNAMNKITEKKTRKKRFSLSLPLYFSRLLILGLRREYK